MIKYDKNVNTECDFVKIFTTIKISRPSLLLIGFDGGHA
jgi:hypothetical protein